MSFPVCSDSVVGLAWQLLLNVVVDPNDQIRKLTYRRFQVLWLDWLTSRERPVLST